MLDIYKGTKWDKNVDDHPKEVTLDGGMTLCINGSNVELFGLFDFCDRCIYHKEHNDDICCKCIVPYLSTIIY